MSSTRFHFFLYFQRPRLWTDVQKLVPEAVEAQLTQPAGWAAGVELPKDLPGVTMNMVF